MTDMPFTVIWEQMDYDGKIVKLSRAFSTAKQREDWIKSMMKSALYIHQFFKVLRKGNDLGEPEEE